MNFFRRLAWKLTGSLPWLWHEQPKHFPGADSCQLVTTLRSEVAQLVRKANENNQSDPEWDRYSGELVANVAERDPSDFLSWPVIQHTMCVTRAMYLDKELDYLRRHRLWQTRWRYALQETSIGHPMPYWVYPWTSGNTIHHLYHLSRFQDAFGLDLARYQLVFEFGGGYGNFCRLLHRLGFHGRYLIFDLPHFSALQRFYLNAVGIRAVSQDEGNNRVQPVLCISDIDLAVGLIRQLNTSQPSLFVATWSLSESPFEVRNRLANYLTSFTSVLIAFQNEIGAMDNARYFSRLISQLDNQFVCKTEAIPHLPGNSYLFASNR